MLFALLIAVSVRIGCLPTAAERRRTARRRTARARRFSASPRRVRTADLHGLARRTRTSSDAPVAYLLPFEIVSVHLLVVLIGAAYLARAKRRAEDVTELGLSPSSCSRAFLFVCGVVCMATKRNAIGVLMGVELVLNAANVNFVAFARYNPAFRLEGQVFALLVIVLAAAEAAVALAIILNFYNNHATVDVDKAEELKG